MSYATSYCHSGNNAVAGGVSGVWRHGASVVIQCGTIILPSSCCATSIQPNIIHSVNGGRNRSGGGRWRQEEEKRHVGRHHQDHQPPPHDAPPPPSLLLVLVVAPQQSSR